MVTSPRPTFLHFSVVFAMNSAHFEEQNEVIPFVEGLRGCHTYIYIYIHILHTHISKPKRCASTSPKFAHVVSGFKIQDCGKSS